MQLPVFFAVLAASWVQGGEASKCNQTLIGLIGTFNEIVQTNILANEIPSPLNSANGFVVVHLPSFSKNVSITVAAPKILYRLKRGLQQKLKMNFRLGPDWTAYTTENFFSNEKELFSVVTDWTEDGKFTYYFYYKKDKPQDAVYGGKLTENNAHTYDEATKTYRYHIRTKGLVDACYRCQENGKEGSPEGMIKVWKGYEDEDVKKAKENVEQLLGCKLSVSYAQFSV